MAVRHRSKRWFLFLSLAMLIKTSLVLAAQVQRGVAVLPQTASVPIAGNYWALIIGINQYKYAPKLESAVRDAQGIRDVLIARYGFTKDHIIELYDAQATGPKIQNALYRLGRAAGVNDSVLIYYAGHGQYEEEGKLGWWVPVEGEPKNPGTFIMNASIRDYINGMTARHVYLIADSCFSGTLFGARALPPISDQWYSRLYQKPSRWGLTSGGKEPVADRGKNGHSIFAYYLISLLQDNSEPYLVPSQIHAKLAPLVANNSDQTPLSEPLRGAGDEGGQFVFRLASVGLSALPPPPISGVPTDEMAQMKAELEALKSQIHKPIESSRPIDIVKASPYIPQTNMPRIMVIVAERHEGSTVPHPSGEAEIIKLLVQNGVRVVDQAQVHKIHEGEVLQQVLTGDLKVAQNLGRQYDADFLIVGEAFSERVIQGMKMGGIMSVRGRLQARVIQVNTGDIITAEEATAPALDVSELVAGKKAISTAAKRWVDAVLPKIISQ